uniref:Translation elongation factor EF1B beta/delta subunit guanine nucleotide exchange domain-containing protein n=1 Tax=Ditylenchus dipsaci TaxID=166011 RepID=A0A915DBC7_9BILA
MASEQSKIAVTSESTATAEILKEGSVEIQLVPDLKVLSDEISAAVAEDEDKERLVQERLKAYADKKAKKPGVIAKSTVIYDVKPWDDTIDVKQIEEKVRAIEKDGLVWEPLKSCQLPMDSTSCRSSVSLRTRKFQRTGWRKKSLPTKIWFSQWMWSLSTRSRQPA